MPQVVGCALPLPVDKVYSYSVPDALEPDVEVGSLVTVPVRHRTHSAVVVSCDEEVDPRVRLRSILAVQETAPVVDSEILRLTRWIARYYVCSWGEAIAAALPNAMYAKEIVRLSLASESPAAWEGLSPVLHAYMLEKRKVTRGGLRAAGVHVSDAELRRAERKGAIQRTVDLRHSRAKIRHQLHVQLKPPHESAQDLVSQVRGHRQMAVLRALHESREAGLTDPPLREILARSGAQRPTVDSLVRKGLLSLSSLPAYRIPEWIREPPRKRDEAPEYHSEQLESIEAIRQALGADRFESLLIQGVTGSGKTEVYLAALETTLARGRNAIVMVPEIALTPQTVRRFRRRFGDCVAVLHSGMADGERYDIWHLLRSGSYRVLIGPRSAILAPMPDLGLVVVDEEHDESYHQSDRAPRYNGRDVAIMRAKMTHAVCVLGSATPSLESTRNAMTGKFRLLSMTRRVPVPGRAAAELPSVRTVDLSAARARGALTGALTDDLLDAIGMRLQRAEQVILLHNRRGFAHIYECQHCGLVPQCIACSVSMTYHQAYNQLRCHYCGIMRRMLVVCPQCGSGNFASLGSGTQRVEEKLREVFPHATVMRMDRDSTRAKGAHHHLLEAFRTGRADILVGTQMIAKGLDFSRVTLVGVVNCDVGLRIPHFKSEERVFQLMMQVSGRAGRAGLSGEVILQTRRPDHPLFEHLMRHDYDGYAKRLLDEREQLRYPPFGRIVGLLVRGPSDQIARKVADQWRDELVAQVPPSVQVLGPEQPYVARQEFMYRYRILLKAPRSYGGLQEDVRRVKRATGSPPADCFVSISVDALT